MPKCVLVLLLLAVMLGLSAQKHDAVWCFGVGGGIDFSDPQNPVAFESKATNQEVNASIADSVGNLIFYLQSNISNDLSLSNRLIDSSGNVLFGGDSIVTQTSITNGALILPPNKNEVYRVFHIGWRKFVCPSGSCYGLFTSSVKFDSVTDSYIVTEQNKLLYDLSIDEKLAAVRHANGEDWWVFVHRYKDNTSGLSPNEFVSYRITSDSIYGPFTQQIGNQYDESFGGEMTFNKQGTLLTKAINREGVIDIFGFNRCDHSLSHIDSIVFTSNESTYGVEFSNTSQFVYITTTDYSNSPPYDEVKLYQYDLWESNQNLKLKELWSTSAPPGDIWSGQLQRAVNGKIYMAFYYQPQIMPGPFDSLTNFLGVINSPDSLGLACDFQPFSFPLADSTISFYGLPNFPNYRLGPLSIYTTSAGADTVFCIEDTVPATFTLGQPDTSNLQYTWWPQDSFANPHLAQQTINLPQGADTLQYILTIGDSTITNACTTRDDTITIILRSCNDDTVGIPKIAQQSLHFRLYPNPNQGNFTIEFEDNISTGKLEVVDLQGRVVHTEAISAGERKKVLSLELAEGLYFIRLSSENQVAQTEKLVIAY